MGERIHAYFLGLGLPPDEAGALHQRYYSEHGLAIRGLLKNHSGIDPLDYDRRVDGSLPLDGLLKPEAALTSLIEDLDRSKCRVFALTNAYKTHALRCIKLLGLEHLFDGIVYCDYAAGPLFCCKPDKEYFAAAAQIVRVNDASKFFFVDDSAKNIKASAGLGWGSSVLYKEDEPVEVQRAVGGNDEGEEKAVKGVNDSLMALGNGEALDEEAIKQRIRSLSRPMRIRLLNIVLDAAMPGDLLSIKRTIEGQIGVTKDIISNLPERLAVLIFERLAVQDVGHREGADSSRACMLTCFFRSCSASPQRPGLQEMAVPHCSSRRMAVPRPRANRDRCKAPLSSLRPTLMARPRAGPLHSRAQLVAWARAGRPVLQGAHRLCHLDEAARPGYPRDGQP